MALPATGSTMEALKWKLCKARVTPKLTTTTACNLCLLCGRSPCFYGQKKLSLDAVVISYALFWEEHEYWRAFTAAFSHVEVLHLFFNMSSTWSLREVEQQLGTLQFLLWVRDWISGREYCCFCPCPFFVHQVSSFFASTNLKGTRTIPIPRDIQQARRRAMNKDRIILRARPSPKLSPSLPLKKASVSGRTPSQPCLFSCPIAYCGQASSSPPRHARLSRVYICFAGSELRGNDGCREDLDQVSAGEVDKAEGQREQTGLGFSCVLFAFGTFSAVGMSDFCPLGGTTSCVKRWRLPRWDGESGLKPFQTRTSARNVLRCWAVCVLGEMGGPCVHGFLCSAARARVSECCAFRAVAHVAVEGFGSRRHLAFGDSRQETWGEVFWVRRCLFHVAVTLLRKRYWRCLSC